MFSSMASDTQKIFLLFIAISQIISSVKASNKMENDLNKLSKANNDLGLKLYQLLVKGETGNVFFSPFSLSNAFGMLSVGARGNSETQLRSVLGYNAANLQRTKVPSAFNQYLEKILPKNQTKDPDYILNLANEMLLAKDLKVYPKYKAQVQDQFHAFIEEVDFKKNSAKIIEEANSFVKEQTHGKIDKLINNLNPDSVVLLLNAIYFKGSWKSKFDKKQTKPQKFYNDGSNTKAKDVPLMHQTMEFPYTSVDNFQVLELPYKGDNISMIVLLPDQMDGLSSLEESITPEKILSIKQQLYSTKVVVTLPQFKIEYKRQVNSDFRKLGAEDIFMPDTADFSGITPDKNIYVSDIIHKAAVDVNEEGSEAAAATAINFVLIAPAAPPLPPKIFKADHPFMFTIIDNRNDMILFLGRVTEL